MRLVLVIPKIYEGLVASSTLDPTESQWDWEGVQYTGNKPATATIMLEPGEHVEMIAPPKAEFQSYTPLQ
jgi:hypothetical protein